jgi:hypothetical protein
VNYSERRLLIIDTLLVKRQVAYSGSRLNDGSEVVCEDMGWARI